MINVSALQHALTAAGTELRAAGPAIARDIASGQAELHAAFQLVRGAGDQLSVVEGFGRSHSSFQHAADAGAMLLGPQSKLATALQGAADAAGTARSLAAQGPSKYAAIDSRLLGPAIGTEMGNHAAYLSAGSVDEMLLRNA